MRRSLLFIIFLGVFSACRVCWSAECTMRAAKIDLNRIAHNTSIKSYVVDVEGQSITVLLKNGRALKLTHGGCDHSGASASLWLDTDLVLSDTTNWIKEATALVWIAFSREIAADISDSLHGGVFEKSETEARVAISASPSSFMSYSVVISTAERGVLLTITYELGQGDLFVTLSPRGVATDEATVRSYNIRLHETCSQTAAHSRGLLMGGFDNAVRKKLPESGE